MQQKRTYTCAVDAAISMIGGKYKVIILYHLRHSTMRFSELQKIIPQATPKMLTQQLRELEADGLILRTVYPVVPPKTEYSMTEFGSSLIPILDSLCDWGNTHLKEYLAQ